MPLATSEDQSQPGVDTIQQPPQPAQVAVVDAEQQAVKLSANIIPRDQHTISRQQLNPNALKVLYRLKDNGYKAYLVGGCIRDILMGVTPKDFDVATNATPEQIKQCFNNCRLIGRRFRLAHIMYGRDVIEVATFRGPHDIIEEDSEADTKTTLSRQSEHGQLLRDNVYGTIEEDVMRRDFTINALYYSIDNFEICDFVNGLEAIDNRTIELIGDPQFRYREDPVRMLRAIRFATKLNMTMARETEQPIAELAPLLGNIPAARLYEESLKLMLSGKSYDNYVEMRRYGLFEAMYPVASEVLDGDPDSKAERLIKQMFLNTDSRINNFKRVTPAYIYAAMLWYVYENEIQSIIDATNQSFFDASQQAMNDVFSRHAKRIALPRRFSTVSRDIWHLQHQLPKRSGRRPLKLLEHPKFRAGYDFLLLRSEIEGGDLVELARWWTKFQDVDEKTRDEMLAQLTTGRHHSAKNKPSNSKSTPRRHNDNRRTRAKPSDSNATRPKDPES